MCVLPLCRRFFFVVDSIPCRPGSQNFTKIKVSVVFKWCCNIFYDQQFQSNAFIMFCVSLCMRVSVCVCVFAT